LLTASTAIRVGIASQGFAFPAPTGVVDTSLRSLATGPTSSAYLAKDSNGLLSAELTADRMVVPDVLFAGFGFGAYRGAYGNGTSERNDVLTQSLLWKPNSEVTLQSFLSFSRAVDSQPPPIYLTVDGSLPPPVRRRQFNGPDWALQRRDRLNYGLLASGSPADGWRLRGGIFRSESSEASSFDNLYLDVNADGRARQLVLADPAGRNASTSGELRLDRDVVSGDTLHRLSATVRGRQRSRIFGGTDAIDLGAIGINQRQEQGRPDFRFGPTDEDDIHQVGVGVGYEYRRKGLGELTLSAMSSDYRKRSTPSDAPSALTEANPMLYSGAAAFHVSDRVSLFSSYSEGLEDSGAAPSSAANRNAPLPASATRQRDAGIRWSAFSGLRLVLGVFSIEKPYFEFDQENVYRQLGTVGNRGVELSLSGTVSPTLNVLVGAVVSNPSLRNTASSTQALGDDPVDLPKSRAGINLDWKPDALRGTSIDLGVTYLGRRAATSDNTVYLPGRAIVDIGGRVPLRIAKRPAQLRLAITNLGDRQGWDSAGSGAYTLLFGRAAELSIAFDF
jgi:iron complex outermembrane receptor protein